LFTAFLHPSSKLQEGIAGRVVPRAEHELVELEEVLQERAVDIPVLGVRAMRGEGARAGGASMRGTRGVGMCAISRGGVSLIVWPARHPSCERQLVGSCRALVSSP
jgi:hypothetical protein